jgi:hypothetical protein
MQNLAVNLDLVSLFYKEDLKGNVDVFKVIIIVGSQEIEFIAGEKEARDQLYDVLLSKITALRVTDGVIYREKALNKFVLDGTQPINTY